ncbi:hypothetical protein [Thalassobellus citreus]|uniref:hypothetical protein n=1 Tax=Thalassobellus citreus TaxID=3367752 RepID=UPI00378968C4
MNNHKITKLILALCFLSGITSCDSNDDVKPSKIVVTDFTKDELIKLNGGSEKSWRLTEVILPEEYKDNPNLLNNACVTDDIYTFYASTSYESVENIKIDLGNTRCYDTYSEAERFEGKLLYVPYKLNGVDVIETTLILKSCSIEIITNDNGTKETDTTCDENNYRLVELTDDRMVFSNAEYIGDYTFGYVFEKVEE